MDPIRSIYEDDPDMLEIVQEFAAELPERVAAIEECLGSNDMDKLQTIAHQLKGAGGGYGFQPITDAGATLEAALKEGADESVVKERSGVLCEVLRAVLVPEAD